MTHNTREVEEMAIFIHQQLQKAREEEQAEKELKARLHQIPHPADRAMLRRAIKKVLAARSKTLHQQLQKAREEERTSYKFDIEGRMYLAKELVKHIEHHDKLDALFERGRVNAFEELLQTLDHSELDQPNK